MAWGFGSSSTSSSSSSSSASSTQAEPPAAPNREQRAACWSTRDAYFDCLTKNNVLVPGEENKGTDGQPISGGGATCKLERDQYERNCGRAWIDYFNKRRGLEFRQRATLEASTKQGVTAIPGAKR